MITMSSAEDDVRKHNALSCCAQRPTTLTCYEDACAATIDNTISPIKIAR